MTDMEAVVGPAWGVLLGFFVITQVVYLGSMLVMAYFYTRPVNLVDPERHDSNGPTYPVLLLYPVLKELESTMRTTFGALDAIDYPRDRYRIVAIPNDNDLSTITSLEQLQSEFSWLEILKVPPTTDPSWDVVWQQWEQNEKAYWWHFGKRSGVRGLPPKRPAN